MAKYLRYYGEFVSVDAHINRVNIYQEAEEPYTPEDLDFPYDSPLLIEWGETSKQDVILGSSCTLKVISPTDRKFTDFYQTKYGECRIDVYRDGDLYWSGCLDTEFYAEPYERLNGYDVTLTFSDFGYLQRARFEYGVGFKKIKQIILWAITKTKCLRILKFSDFDDSFEWSETQYEQAMAAFDEMLCSTLYGTKSVLNNAYIRTDNFCDETGEWMTYSEILEAILKPLNLRLVQMGGFIYLYDLNGLYWANKDFVKKAIYWTSNKQDFQYDVTYNNVKITWSPYAQSDNMSPTECWPDNIATSAKEIALNNLNGRAVGDALIFSYPLDNFYIGDEEFKEPGFTLWTAASAKNIELGRLRRVFKIVPQYDGSEAEGVIAYFCSAKGYVDKTAANSNNWVKKVSYKEFYVSPISHWGVTPGDTLLTTPHVVIPPQSEEAPLQLRVKMECLLDCRINPFEDPFLYWSGKTTATCVQAMTRMNEHANYLFLPIKVCFKPINSTDIYYYSNDYIVGQNRENAILMYKSTFGIWRKNNPNSFTYLAYYNVKADERKSSTAVCKWTANRQATNVHYYDLNTALQKIEDGQYITYPTINGECVPGELWLEVMGSGWIVANGGDHLGDDEHNKQTDRVSEVVSFAAVKLPEVEILNNNLFDQAITFNDVVYNAEVDENAKEELTINTTIGSYTSAIPTARGVLFDDNGSQISNFSRRIYENVGGVNVPTPINGTLEELLAGTMFSQYYGRHVVLSGEYKIDTKKYLSFTEQNQGDKIFICVSETQDLRTDTADAKFIELSPDTYKKE